MKVHESYEELRKVYEHNKVPLVSGDTLHRVTYTTREKPMTSNYLEDLILVNDNEQRAVYLLAQGLHQEYRPMFDTYLSHYARHLKNKLPDTEAKYLAFVKTEREYVLGDK